MRKETKRSSVWEEVEPYCVLHTIWKNLWMVLVSALLFMMLAYSAVTLLMKPSYTCKTTFAVTPKVYSASYVTGSSAVTTSAAENFASFLSGTTLVKRINREYGGLVSGAKVTTRAVEGTNLIEMTTTADSPSKAYYMTYGILDNYDDYKRYVLLDSVMLEQYTTPTVPDNSAFLHRQRKIILLSAPLGALMMMALLAVLCIISRTVQTTAGARNQIDGKMLITIGHQNKHRTLKSRILRKKSSLLISNPTTSFIYVEGIHQLRVKLEKAKRQDGCRIFLFTSVGENEGKSTVAANVALSLAQKHKRVLLVDCDLRKSAQHLIFQAKPEPEKTLNALLKSELEPSTLVSAMQYRKSENLFCLYAESMRRHSAELLGSAQMRKLLGVLRESFDYVILDSSPMGFFTDSEVLSEQADATVLVVRQDRATDVSINDAIDSLKRCSALFLGYVFNDVHTLNVGAVLVGGRRYGYGYGYGHSYGYGYGYGKYKSYYSYGSGGKGGKPADSDEEEPIEPAEKED